MGRDATKVVRRNSGVRMFRPEDPALNVERFPIQLLRFGVVAFVSQNVRPSCPSTLVCRDAPARGLGGVMSSVSRSNFSASAVVAFVVQNIRQVVHRS